MSDRLARATIVGVLVILGVVVARTRIPQFWGDGATYHSMAWSLAEDGDVEYEARDIYRVRREFPSGPQGLFLKRSSGGFSLAEGFPWLRRVPEAEPRLYFAKALAYPVAAAPLVRLFGTRGLLFTNLVFFGLALWLGYGELRRQTQPLPALVASLSLFLGTVTPAYLVWPAPEIMNLGLVVAGLVAWRRGRGVLSACILGIAIYSKPYNLWLAIPLGLAPLLGRRRFEEGKAIAREAWRGRLAECARRGAALCLSVGALFAANAVVTGEANYQGGRERKTFYGTFPFELDGAREVTFGNSGIWMSTNTPGPRVVGQEGAAERGAEPAREAAEYRQSFVHNLGYFWWGRFGGLLPYFLPFVLAVLAYVALGPRDPAGWLTLVSLGVSQAFYLHMIPDNWYGGSGTLGNRYALNLLPLGLLLVPRGREWVLGLGALLGTALFTGPMLMDPVGHALAPGRHATGGAYRFLPAELSMLNDLFSEAARKKQPVGDTEGDPHKHWPADPKAYYLYFPDDATFLREAVGEAVGFWVKGGQDAEVIVRALEPVRRMNVRLTGGPSGDLVTIRTGAGVAESEVTPGGAAVVGLDPGRPFVYKDTFVYVVRLRSRRGGEIASPPEKGRRSVGAFVAIELDVANRRRPPGQR